MKPTWRLVLAGIAGIALGIVIVALIRAGGTRFTDRGAEAGTSRRLSEIRRRGEVTCGVWPEVAGFSQKGGDGTYSGLDVDMCRAVAAAILGSADKVRFVELPTVQGFLESNDIDLVSRRLTWELQREGALGLLFGPVMFYDGQSFLVPARLGISKVAQLAGKSVCVRPVSHSEVTLELYFRVHGLALNKVPLDTAEDLGVAFASGRCQAYTHDATMLGALRTRLPRPGDFSILSELITKEPLAQIVRKGDDGFFDVLRWTVFATIQAEELGVTSANIREMLGARNLDIKRLLGVVPGNGKALGLDEKWAYNIIESLGNYGEMFERNVGRLSSVRMERGMNRLWTEGGLMYAPPLR